jgi:amidase
MGPRSDITDLSAVELAAAIRSGDLRAVDAVAAFLDRIDRVNPTIHAVASVDRASALRDAEAADRARSAGGPVGPLHGVPMTVKDGLRVAGSRSTFGLPHLRWHRPRDDSEAVARLRRAGAVILGRTAVPFACFDWQCRPPLARECVNPLDPARTPGGSSGGAAAALAARLTPLELGTDVAGSIRYPAHCCGVFGLRTTVGLVPADDAGPQPGKPLFPSVLSVGPMARSAEDLELLLGALLPEPDGREVEPPARDRLRVAVTPSVPAAPTDEPTAAALRGFAASLREAGHEVTELDRPPYDFDAAFAVWGLLAGYEFKRLMPWGARNGLAVRAFAAWFLRYRLGDGPLTATMRRGMLASEAEYRDGMARRDELIVTMERFFETFDLWALPVSPAAAIRRQQAGRPILCGGRPLPYSQVLGTYLCPTAPAGTPALVVPVGADAAGLPIGVQVHAPRFADRWLARVARSHLTRTRWQSASSAVR